MARTYTLERTQFLPLSIEQTFAFFEDATNLEAITPDSVHFRIVTPAPIEMQSGTQIDYRLRIAGVPVKWRTLIETYEPPFRFVDTQLKGPYKLWHHTHSFEAVNGGTQMKDVVKYQIGFGPFGRIAHRLFVQKMLDDIFEYRKIQIERLLTGSVATEKAE